MSQLEKQIETIEVVSELDALQFYQTQPHACSYLDKETASTVFLSPKQTVDKTLYAQLSEYGFRRSGAHIYKPLCADCNACVPMRIPTALFKPNRNQKRVWKRNQDIKVHQVKTIDTEEHYLLYERYINERHQDGDMYPASQQQFRNFLCSQWHSACYFECRVDNKLIATSVADVMDNGVSAVYTYFDPDEDKRSLGTYAILMLINKAKQYHLPSVYLGYWIKNSSKMNYKSVYRPLEIQQGDRWLLVN